MYREQRELFGEIVDVGAGSSCPIMKLNPLGNIIEQIYKELSMKYPNMKYNEFVIMPNHFHCIIEIVENTKGGKTPPLPNIIGYFKFQTTKIYNEILNVKNEKFVSLWQRNYYENIIKNEKRYLQVIDYIKNNPLKMGRR